MNYSSPMPNIMVPPKLQEVLLPGEQVVWSGRPRRATIQEIAVPMVMILVMAYWSLAYSYWDRLLLWSSGEQGAEFPFWLLVIVGFMFVDMVQILMIYRNRRITYAITTRRVVVICSVPWLRITSLMLDPESSVEVLEEKTESGSLRTKSRLPLQLTRLGITDERKALYLDVTFVRLEHVRYAEAVANWVINTMVYEERIRAHQFHPAPNYSVAS